MEGSYDRHLVRDALVTKDMTFGRSGWARALTGAGLGVQVAAGALRRVTVREQGVVG